MIVDAYQDMFNAGNAAYFGKGGDASTIPECLTKYLDEEVPKFLTFLEPYCARGSFLVGSKINIADFWVGTLISDQLANASCALYAGKYADYPA